MTRQASGLKSSNDQIVTFTLVELLTALVFIAMLLALVLKTEALANLDPSRENVKRLKDELALTAESLKQAEAKLRDLEAELAAQRSLVRRLMAEAGKPLPASDYVVVEQDRYDAVRNAQAVAEEQQDTIQGLQKQIAALKGGASLTRPSCTTNSGYLLTVQLNADGTFSPRPTWPAIANQSVAKIDGISAFKSGSRMSRGSFAAASRRLDQWARSQRVPCAFRVKVTSSHGNLSLYLSQLATVEQSFYVLRAR